MTYKPNEADRAVVKALTAGGYKIKAIAEYLDITDKTVSKYYKDVIKKTQMDRNLIVANNLFRMTKKNVTAAIFWLKTQAAWKEEDGGSAEEPVPLQISFAVTPAKGDVKVTHGTEQEKKKKHEQ